MPQSFENLDAANDRTQLTDRAIFLAAFRKLFDEGLTIPAGVTIPDISSGEWETVAAGQTAQALGATGAIGDYLSGLLIVPATTSPGAVSIKDGGGSDISVFTGGASSVSNLVPFFVPLGIKSIAGPWKVTTGADVSVIGIGNFTA